MSNEERLENALKEIMRRTDFILNSPECEDNTMSAEAHSAFVTVNRIALDALRPSKL